MVDLNWLTKNWSLKIISLILAVGLWYYAVGEEGIEVTRTIPLTITVENPQMSILKTSVHAIQVTFLSPRGQVSDLTSEEIRVEHTIKKEINKAGDYSFRLEPGEIKIKSPQIRIIKLEPEVVQVTLDEIMVKKMEIKPQFAGDPAFGYSIHKEEIQLNPNAVLIEGPKGTLEKLDGVKTQKVTLVGRTRSFRQTVALELPSNLRLIGESVIDLFVPIVEESDEKEIKDVPLKVVQTAGGDRQIEINPSKVSFVIKGSKKQLEKTTAENIFAYVNAEDLKNGEYDLPVAFFLPDEIAIKGEPLKVKVKVKR